MIILLHSSKTMRTASKSASHLQTPYFLEQADELVSYIKAIDDSDIAKVMSISDNLAEKVRVQFNEWTNAPRTAAIDAFIGDIYSGLQVADFSLADRAYANKHLYILSGLYGVLRALDTISPYRLEMAYRFEHESYKSLYAFWGTRLAEFLPSDEPIINVSSAEYTKSVLPYLKERAVVTPKFMTVNTKIRVPTFVTVHAKIARGAFAHWMIKHRVEDLTELTQFDELGYAYEPSISTKREPVFVCREFGGLGLSVRLN